MYYKVYLLHTKGCLFFATKKLDVKQPLTLLSSQIPSNLREVSQTFLQLELATAVRENFGKKHRPGSFFRKGEIQKNKTPWDFWVFLDRGLYRNYIYIYKPTGVVHQFTLVMNVVCIVDV